MKKMVAVLLCLYIIISFALISSASAGTGDIWENYATFNNKHEWYDYWHKGHDWDGNGHKQQDKGHERHDKGYGRHDKGYEWDDSDHGWSDSDHDWSDSDHDWSDSNHGWDDSWHEGHDNSPVAPEPVSSLLFIVGGATLGFRFYRKKADSV